MKELKKFEQHTICKLSEREKKDRATTYNYVAVPNDEMSNTSNFRAVDWESDSIEELVEWCES